MRCLVMFIIAVCLLFLLKLKWPKNKNVLIDNMLEKGWRHLSNKASDGVIIYDIKSKPISVREISVS